VEGPAVFLNGSQTDPLLHTCRFEQRVPKM
jgi:hypothetical protein